MRYSNAEISISFAQPFISGPKDNILAPKSCISPTKYDHPHPNTPPDARKHNPDDETTQFDDELRHSDTETRHISNRIRILIQKQYTSTRVIVNRERKYDLGAKILSFVPKYMTASVK